MEKRKWCDLCGFAVLPSEVEEHCSYWDCPINPVKIPDKSQDARTIVDQQFTEGEK